MNKEQSKEEKNDKALNIGGVSVRYFYNGKCTIDSCGKCGGNNIETYTSDWLRMEKMNRKECVNCRHHWLVNAH